RRQLGILKEFVAGFDFIRMKPDPSVLRGDLVSTPRQARRTVRALAEVGRAYAVYVNGGTQGRLVLDLPANRYTAEWVDTKTGKVARAERFTHGGGEKALASPVYSEDIALRVKRMEAR